MSSQKFKIDGYCVGGRHKSGTKKLVGEITINKKTGKEVKLLVGRCVICDRKKTMIVSDNVIQAEGLGNFFKNLGKFSSKAGKKLAKNLISNPRRALDLTAKIATAAASKSPKAALSTLPEVINFYHMVKVFISENLYKHSYKSTIFLSYSYICNYI